MEGGSSGGGQTAVGECIECGETALVVVAGEREIRLADPRGECGCGSTEFRPLSPDEALSRLDDGK